MQLRLTAALPLLLTGIALILSYLCVFAGTNHDMIENADILLLNTSRIGFDVFNTTKPISSNSDAGSSWLGSLVHNATKGAQKVTDQLENEIETAVNSKLQSIAKEIGLHDFYSVHILNYCDGYFKHNTSARNVTHCTNSTGSFSFDPAATLSKELNQSVTIHPKMNITLSDLHWPDAVTEGIRDVRWVFHLMFFLYCFGLFFISCAFLANIAGILLGRGRLVPFVNASLACLAFGFLVIASAAVTFAGKHAADAVNEFGKEIGVDAVRGMKFVRMTWTAVTLVGLSAVCWVVEFFLAFRSNRMLPKEYN